MKMQLALIVLVSLACSALAAKLPVSFELCKRGEPKKLDECLMLAIKHALPKMKNGIPSLNVEPLEPLIIESATVGEGKGFISVEQNYKHVRIYGVTRSVVDKVDTQFTPDNFNNFKLVVEAHADEYQLEADYNITGKVLFFKLKGNGPCHVAIKDTKVELAMSGETFEREDKRYLRVTDCKVTLKPEKVSYQFDNLINGDEELNDEINFMLNKNWNLVFDDVKAGYEGMLGTVFKNYINSIFSKVPLDYLFPK